MNVSAIKMSRLTALLAGAVMVLMLVAPLRASAAPGKSEAAMAAKPGNATIVDIVLADDGEFDVLQAAVIETGLVDALSGNRQYTVFAPTDAAFVTTLKAVDEAAAITAVQNMDKTTLTNILLYHVMSGRHTSTSVLARSSYPMLNGDRLSKSQLLTAGIFATDKSASNGVVHIINRVLIP
jgi:uncharacterized surface protein with fasciclin (FAS1) repeats